ncbi:hypothetical protein BgiMline_000422 [Biomphalaria glabrata]|nr:hypothetical protein BgiMline_000400 [Biomphalaria glabrata]
MRTTRGSMKVKATRKTAKSEIKSQKLKAPKRSERTPESGLYNKEIILLRKSKSAPNPKNETQKIKMLSSARKVTAKQLADLISSDQILLPIRKRSSAIHQPKDQLIQSSRDATQSLVEKLDRNSRKSVQVKRLREKQVHSRVQEQQKTVHTHESSQTQQLITITERAQQKSLFSTTTPKISSSSAKRTAKQYPRSISGERVTNTSKPFINKTRKSKSVSPKRETCSVDRQKMSDKSGSRARNATKTRGTTQDSLTSRNIGISEKRREHISKGYQKNSNDQPQHLTPTLLENVNSKKRALSPDTSQSFKETKKRKTSLPFSEPKKRMPSEDTPGMPLRSLKSESENKHTTTPNHKLAKPNSTPVPKSALKQISKSQDRNEIGENLNTTVESSSKRKYETNYHNLSPPKGRNSLIRFCKDAKLSSSIVKQNKSNKIRKFNQPVSDAFIKSSASVSKTEGTSALPHPVFRKHSRKLFSKLPRKIAPTKNSSCNPSSRTPVTTPIIHNQRKNTPSSNSSLHVSRTTSPSDNQQKLRPILNSQTPNSKSDILNLISDLRTLSTQLKSASKKSKLSQENSPNKIHTLNEMKATEKHFSNRKSLGNDGQETESHGQSTGQLKKSFQKQPLLRNSVNSPAHNSKGMFTAVQNQTDKSAKRKDERRSTTTTTFLSPNTFTRSSRRYTSDNVRRPNGAIKAKTRLIIGGKYGRKKTKRSLKGSHQKSGDQKSTSKRCHNSTSDNESEDRLFNSKKSRSRRDFVRLKTANKFLLVHRGKLGSSMRSGKTIQLASTPDAKLTSQSLETETLTRSRQIGNRKVRTPNLQETSRDFKNQMSPPSHQSKKQYSSSMKSGNNLIRQSARATKSSSMPISAEVSTRATRSRSTSMPTSAKVFTKTTRSRSTSMPTSAKVFTKATRSKSTSIPTSAKVFTKATRSRSTSIPISDKVSRSATRSKSTSIPTSAKVFTKATRSRSTSIPISDKVSRSATRSRSTSNQTRASIKATRSKSTSNQTRASIKATRSKSTSNQTRASIKATRSKSTSTLPSANAIPYIDVETMKYNIMSSSKSKKRLSHEGGSKNDRTAPPSSSRQRTSSSQCSIKASRKKLARPAPNLKDRPKVQTDRPSRLFQRLSFEPVSSSDTKTFSSLTKKMSTKSPAKSIDNLSVRESTKAAKAQGCRKSLFNSSKTNNSIKNIIQSNSKRKGLQTIMSPSLKKSFKHKYVQVSLIPSLINIQRLVTKMSNSIAVRTRVRDELNKTKREICSFTDIISVEDLLSFANDSNYEPGYYLPLEDNYSESETVHELQLKSGKIVCMVDRKLSYSPSRSKRHNRAINIDKTRQQELSPTKTAKSSFETEVEMTLKNSSPQLVSDTHEDGINIDAIITEHDDDEEYVDESDSEIIFRLRKPSVHIHDPPNSSNACLGSTEVKRDTVKPIIDSISSSSFSTFGKSDNNLGVEKNNLKSTDPLTDNAKSVNEIDEILSPGREVQGWLSTEEASTSKVDLIVPTQSNYNETKKGSKGNQNQEQNTLLASSIKTVEFKSQGNGSFINKPHNNSNTNKSSFSSNSSKVPKIKPISKPKKQKKVLRKKKHNPVIKVHRVKKHELSFMFNPSIDKSDTDSDDEQEDDETSEDKNSKATGSKSDDPVQAIDMSDIVDESDIFLLSTANAKNGAKAQKASDEVRPKVESIKRSMSSLPKSEHESTKLIGQEEIKSQSISPNKIVGHKTTSGNIGFLLREANGKHSKTENTGKNLRLSHEALGLSKLKRDTRRSSKKGESEIITTQARQSPRKRSSSAHREAGLLESLPTADFFTNPASRKAVSAQSQSTALQSASTSVSINSHVSQTRLQTETMKKSKSLTDLNLLTNDFAKEISLRPRRSSALKKSHEVESERFQSKTQQSPLKKHPKKASATPSMLKATPGNFPKQADMTSPIGLSSRNPFHLTNAENVPEMISPKSLRMTRSSRNQAHANLVNNSTEKPGRNTQTLHDQNNKSTIRFKTKDSQRQLLQTDQTEHTIQSNRYLIKTQKAERSIKGVKNEIFKAVVESSENTNYSKLKVLKSEKSGDSIYKIINKDSEQSEETKTGNRRKSSPRKQNKRKRVPLVLSQHNYFHIKGYRKGRYILRARRRRSAADSPHSNDTFSKVMRTCDVPNEIPDKSSSPAHFKERKQSSAESEEKGKTPATANINKSVLFSKKLNSGQKRTTRQIFVRESLGNLNKHSMPRNVETLGLSDDLTSFGTPALNKIDKTDSKKTNYPSTGKAKSNSDFIKLKNLKVSTRRKDKSSTTQSQKLHPSIKPEGSKSELHSTPINTYRRASELTCTERSDHTHVQPDETFDDIDFEEERISESITGSLRNAKNKVPMFVITEPTPVRRRGLSSLANPTRARVNRVPVSRLYSFSNVGSDSDDNEIQGYFSSSDRVDTFSYSGEKSSNCSGLWTPTSDLGRRALRVLDRRDVLTSPLKQKMDSSALSSPINASNDSLDNYTKFDFEEIIDDYTNSFSHKDYLAGEEQPKAALKNVRFKFNPSDSCIIL